jgi:hypothetical protein
MIVAGFTRGTRPQTFCFRANAAAAPHGMGRPTGLG